MVPIVPPPLVAAVQNIADPSTPLRKRPARIPGLLGTSAAFLVPDHIRKKFADGWNVHVPLTFLTDKGCLFKDKSSTSASQDILTIDNTTGRILTTSNPLSDKGELNLTFDEWHQAWRRLLDLIKTFLPEDFDAWKTHYTYILEIDNRAELWPLYLAYDAEIRRRTTQLPIDPAEFSIGIWNDLETRYNADKAAAIVQADLARLFSFNNNNSRNPNKGSSFRNQQPSSQTDTSKTGRCIFCGDFSKTHLSRNCSSSSNINGTPCHLSRHEPTNSRHSQSGKRYCYAWNGPSGCDRGQASCNRGEHLCTLCSSKSHTAQLCTIVA